MKLLTSYVENEMLNQQSPHGPQSAGLRNSQTELLHQFNKDRHWMIIEKHRQVGFTQLVIYYMQWYLERHQNKTAIFITHNRDMIKHIKERLITNRDVLERIHFGTSNHTDFVGLSVDLAIIDEMRWVNMSSELFKMLVVYIKDNGKLIIGSSLDKHSSTQLTNDDKSSLFYKLFENALDDKKYKLKPYKLTHIELVKLFTNEKYNMWTDLEKKIKAAEKSLAVST